MTFQQLQTIERDLDERERQLTAQRGAHRRIYAAELLARALERADAPRAGLRLAA